MTLQSADDGVEVQLEVEALAKVKLGELGDKATQTDCFFEHGGWWVKLWNLPPAYGAHDDEETWRVVDTSAGLELEEL